MRFISAGIVVVGGVLLAAVALQRPVDGDEGVYLFAAHRVAEGAVPYRDFSYQQFPYALYAYAAGGPSLTAVRMISVGFGVASLALFAAIVRGRGWAVALLAANNLFLAWTPVFKTYALTVAGTLLAFYLVQKPGRARLFLAGAALGVVVGSRALFAPLIPLFAVWLMFPAEDRWKRAGLFAAGAAVALIPCAVMAASYSDAFMLSTFGIHAARTPEPSTGPLQRLQMLYSLVARPQSIVVLGLAAFGLFRERTRATKLALGCAVLLGAVSLAPSPTFEQYMVCVLPFLLIVSVPALDLPRVPTALVFILYTLAGRQEYVMNVRSHSHDGDRLEEVERVVTSLRTHAAPGETILAFWPGYATLSGTRLPDGLEGPLSPWIVDRLTPAQKAALKVPTLDEIERWIRERRFRIVVVGSHRFTFDETARLRDRVRSSGYREVSSGRGREVFVRE